MSYLNPKTISGSTLLHYFNAICRIRIPGQARQVLDYIFCQTFGWNKSFDYITLNQLSTGTGLSKVSILKSIKILQLINILEVNPESKITQLGNNTKCSSPTSKDTTSGNITQLGNVTQLGNKKPPRSNLYKINLNSNLWKPLPKKSSTSKPKKTITQLGNTELPNKVLPIVNIKNNKLRGANVKLKSNHKITGNTFLFLELWKIYPKKTKKYQSSKFYRLLKPRPSLHKKIIASVQSYINSDLWEKVRYIPSLFAFLENKLYLDEVPPKEKPPDQSGKRTRSAEETTEYLKRKGLSP